MVHKTPITINSDSKHKKEHGHTLSVFFKISDSAKELSFSFLTFSSSLANSNN